MQRQKWDVLETSPRQKVSDRSSSLEKIMLHVSGVSRTLGLSQVTQSP